ncbi:MAG: outer membrane protein assembly factor BamA [Ignavibacteriales bacterium]|nr:outer membrane protein assembly factor BamA [Ignavibacteriales bacterium]MCB9218531.1 outer membrane protein assembly factor BamA [Ignavibacteriales bacterium]MCB9259463.1 outer membrane protein assembly factor BamA [Ignavibacteriales bacterium]
MPINLLKKLSILLLLANTIAFAQFNRANYNILGINVEGNKTADANTIISVSGLKEGKEIEIPGDATNNAIKQLWALGIFDDVQILIDKKVDNGVFLLIKVKELSRVEETIFRGNDELDEDDLEKEITFVGGQTLKPQEISKSISKIKALYEDDGFLNAIIKPIKFAYFEADTSDDEITVTWKNVNDPDDEIETEYEYDPDIRSNIIGRIKERQVLLFDIEEGEEVKVNSISFEGNKAFDDGDLKSEFDETVENTWWRFWSAANFKKEDYIKDKELITTFYQKNGYRDFSITSDSIKLSDDKKLMDITLNVYEGPQYKIRNVSWNGNTVYPDDILTERLGFEKGDIYNYELFNQNLYGNQAQTDVASLYLDNGYLTFRQEAKEQKIGDDSIDVSIKVTENNQFKIGKVEIAGNDRTKDKVIRRELFTIPGDYFRRSNIFRSIQQLANLNYFNVEQLYQKGVDYRPANDSTVNLIYTVEEKSSDFINASVGYSGYYGFSGAIGVTLTNFSITEPFQLGGGQIINFNWQFGVGNFYRTFTLGFTEPWFMDTPTSLGFDLFDTRQQYIYDLHQSGITLRAGRRLKWPDDRFYLQGLFRFQYNDVINGRSYYAEGISRQFTAGLILSRNDIDNPIFPSTGSRINFSGELSGGPLLPGDVDYYKIEFKADWYRRLFNSNRLTFYTGVDLGYIHELVKGTTIQPFEYFYMGGNGLVIATTPLRGYADRTVGPQSTSGFTIGGRVKAKYVAEIRAALTLEPMPIYILAFAEAGNTFESLPNADLFELRKSAGIGARILINPIGLIGFDYGYGFDRMAVDGQDPKWEFHFQFGKGF